MSELQMGYVGCGFMAQAVHIPNIMALDGCRLTALAEVRPGLGGHVRDRLGIDKLYGSHRELAVDPAVEAVAVSAHFAVQGEIAIDLLTAGKDVFMEKPMAVTGQQAERIVAAERESGRRLMVGYMKRYDAGNRAVRERIRRFRESGELGAIRFVRNHGFCGDWTAGLDVPLVETDEPYPATPDTRPAWCPAERHGGYIGYLQQYTHNVNLLRWLLDAGDDWRVTAVDLDDSDGVSGVVVLDVGGVRCVVESGSVPYHGWEEHTQVYFEKGWVRTEAPPLLLRNVPATVQVYRGDGEEKTLTDTFPEHGRDWSYKAEMRHFVDCVRTGAPFDSPAADALQDVRMLEEIYGRHVAQPRDGGRQ